MRYRDSVAAGLRVLLFGMLFGAAILTWRGNAPGEVAPELSTSDVVAELIVAYDCKVEGYGERLIPGHAIVDTGTGPRYSVADPAWEIYEGTREGKIYAWCI